MGFEETRKQRSGIQDSPHFRVRGCKPRAVDAVRNEPHRSRLTRFAKAYRILHAHAFEPRRDDLWL